MHQIRIKISFDAFSSSAKGNFPAWLLCIWLRSNWQSSRSAGFFCHVCVTLASRYCAIKLMRFHHSSETARNSSEFVSSSNLLLSISPENKNKHLPHATRRISFCARNFFKVLASIFQLAWKSSCGPREAKTQHLSLLTIRAQHEW